MKNYKVKDLFDLNHTLAKPLLEQAEYPWEVLGQIKEFIIQLGHSLSAEEYDEVAENVWIAKTAKIPDFMAFKHLKTLVYISPHCFNSGITLKNSYNVSWFHSFRASTGCTMCLLSCH